MTSHPAVIASGNLATARRTVTGVLGQLALLQIPDRKALEMFTDAGLPPRALEEPDFPISLEQELRICSDIVGFLGDGRSVVRRLFERHRHWGIENLGALGMVMRHAPTALDALKACLTFPQLTWGHSRMIVSREPGITRFSFAMERPVVPEADSAHIDRLVQYCLVLDLVSSLRNIEDILEGDGIPLSISFPFPEPDDWPGAGVWLPCPVTFSADTACLIYSAALQDLPLPRANPLVYRSFVAIAERQSLMLAEEIGLAERVSRWLWAYTPPLRRGEIARQLAMSERSLTRQLGREGTSYAQLLAAVQRERAQNFLRNGALSVSAIGYRLGYTEPAAFTRAFTQWTGMSPLKWRRQFADRDQPPRPG